MVDTLIARQKFCNLKLDNDDLADPDIELKIEKAIALISKYAMTELEVVMVGRECPKCKTRGEEGKLLERIDISDKTGKPYHRIKCEHEHCDHIQWVEVEFKK